MNPCRWFGLIGMFCHLIWVGAAWSAPETAPTSAPSSDAMRVLVIGDQLDVGGHGKLGYRDWMDRLFNCLNVPIVLADDGIWQQGHAPVQFGLTIEQANGQIKSWLKQYQPAVVVIQLGSEDLKTLSDRQAAKQLQQLVETIMRYPSSGQSGGSSASAPVHVVLMTVPGCPEVEERAVRAMNRHIRYFGMRLRTADRQRVSVVDLREMMDTASVDDEGRLDQQTIRRIGLTAGRHLVAMTSVDWSKVRLAEPYRSIEPFLQAGRFGQAMLRLGQLLNSRQADQDKEYWLARSVLTILTEAGESRLDALKAQVNDGKFAEAEPAIAALAEAYHGVQIGRDARALAVNADQQKAEQYMLKAVHAMQQGKMTEARDWFEQLKREYPDHELVTVAEQFLQQLPAQ